VVLVTAQDRHGKGVQVGVGVAVGVKPVGEVAEPALIVQAGALGEVTLVSDVVEVVGDAVSEFHGSFPFQRVLFSGDVAG
jgi:hypothetical protein